MLLALSGSWARAQEASPAPAEVKPESRVSAPQPSNAPVAGPSAPAGLLESWPFDIWYLRGDDGRAVVVPDKASVREYLEYLTRRAHEEDAPLKYSIAELVCQGVVEEERVLLRVTLQIQVLAEDEWVLVPLQMAEGTLREPPLHKGPGRAVAAPFQADTGYAWWFQGRGEHTLTMVIGVRPRAQGTARRLQLPIPSATYNSLRLKVPAGKVTARSSERSIVTTRTAGQGTEIEVSGLGNRLDLTWQILPETPAQEASYDVLTSVNVALVEGRTVTLESQQRIQTTGQTGTIDELRVSLPPDSELIRIEGPETLEYQADAEQPNRAVIRFKKPPLSPIELKWTVRARLPEGGRQFVLSGFDVERSRSHTGFVGVSLVGDYRLISPSLDDDRLTQRISLSDLPPSLRQSRTEAGFRFLNRLHLPLAVEHIQPYVTAAAGYALVADRREMELNGSLNLQIRPGSIADLDVVWPDWKQDGWVIELVDASGDVRPRLDERLDDPDRVRFAFTTPARGAVELRFRARRTLGDETDVLPVAVPRPAVDASSPAHLSVFSGANLQVEISGEKSGTVRALAPAMSRVVAPRDLQRLRRSDYVLDQSTTTLAMRLTAHRQEIQTSTTAEAVVRGNLVQVQQRILYNVVYEDLTELVLVLPESLPEGSIRLYTASGTEWVTLTERGDGASSRLRLPLDPPRLGKIEVVAHYTVALPQDSSEHVELTLPLVQSADAAFSLARFSWRDPFGRDAEVLSSGWSQNLTPEGLPEWSQPGAPEELLLNISRQRPMGRGPVVSRGLISTAVGLDGVARTRAEYRLSGSIPEISIISPAGIDVQRLWWNQRLMALGEPHREADGSLSYAVVAPRTDRETPLITLEAVTTDPVQLRSWKSFDLTVPRISAGLPTIESLWRVSIPGNMHLFNVPEGFAAEQSWRFSRGWWAREPDRTPEDLETWIGREIALAPQEGESAANIYLFSRSGAATKLPLSAVSLGGVVLVGAGLALALGWILVQFPASRSVLSFLTGTFLVALAAVWYPEPVLVLLQPAVFGLLLAVTAAAYDSYLKRRRRPISVTLASPSSFLTPAPTVTHAAPPLGSEEYTSLRVPPDAGAPDSLEHLSETGSRA